MKFWIVYYKQRHGDDAWPVFQNRRPSEASIIKEIKASYDAYDENEDEFSVYGPFSVPKPKEER